MLIFFESLLSEIFYDFYLFLKFWFYDSLKFLFNEFLKNLLSIEKKFSIRLNIKHFFEPLYGIKSIEGYFYAIPLRLIIILISILLHIINILALILFIIFWISMPFFITFVIYNGKIF